MTEYWVSQGKKWCDFCKIYIANNPLSIRTHELGERHKDSVAKRLTSMRKENAAKEKEQKETVKALEQIEAKASRSYQKDLAAFQQANDSSSHAETAQAFSVSRDGWEFDGTSGYYIHGATGFYYDTMSGLYYSDALGKWVTPDEAFPASQGAQDSTSKKIFSASESETDEKYHKGTPPGLVVSGSVNPMRSVKGAQSSIAVNKRKRQNEKTKVVTKEEEDALKAREAAKKRMEEREKPMLGLYKSY